MSDVSRGERGERGPRGDHGQEGDIGITGLEGPKGEPGTNGNSIVAWVIAGLALISTVLSWIVLANTNSFAEDLRDSAIRVCERQNEVRQAERQDSRQDIANDLEEIAQSKQTPREFFPNIPPAEFDRLIQLGITRARADIAEEEETIEILRDVDCANDFPAN